MENTASQIVVWILSAPLISAIIIALFLRRSGNIAAYLSCGAALAIAALSFKLFELIGDAGDVYIHFANDFFSMGAFTINIGFLVNANTLTMLFVVSFVAFWIHIFSLGYMRDDDAKARYFGGLSIFMFSMLGIVFADNLVMVFIFWELVGFSSYALISHYFKTSEAANASKKAFIVNRVGDLGFLIGIVAAYWQFGTVNFVELQENAGINPQLVNSCIVALLMCGFIGKSAQFPLHVWLPDAMAGPTPVSALIHAATMVAAGIFFLVRIEFLFTPEVLNLVAWLGTIMAVYAGLCAIAQNDIKKILAYSTLSQLGYMAAAFGLGYPGLALFHLATHVFFKGLLFLGSGSVIYGCHHEQDIFKMGGLVKKMPITTFTFAVGIAALCGVNYFSGYFSKDSILIAAYAENPSIFWILMFSAFVTAFYMGRLFWIAFCGKPNSDHSSHAKESSFVMLVPLLVLSVLAIAGGFVELWPENLSASFISNYNLIHGHITSELSESYHHGHSLLTTLGPVAFIAGLLGSFLFYGMGAKSDNLQRSVPVVFNILKSKLLIDEAYLWYVKNVQQKFADFINLMDLLLIGGLCVRGSAGFVGLLGYMSRALHTGSIGSYVFWLAIGMIVYWAYALGFFS
jgi:NADH-quinone oxidoreductase subunit L